MELLSGKTALVTGASSGIGMAISEALARQGVRIAACARSQQGLETLRNRLEAMKGSIITGLVDVAKHEQIVSFAEKVRNEFGAIDILIANAGIGLFKNVSELAPDEFDAVIATNLRGAYSSVKAVLAGMIKEQRGDIVFVSSLAGKNGFPSGAVYCASKFGVRGFAQSLMLEVRDRNIRVITIFPGSVDTAFFDTAPMTPNRDKILAADDVAETVLSALLASRRAMVSEIDIRPSNPK
jgi:3-oxoacyl-[acyl-carrier protein] reductase